MLKRTILGLGALVGAYVLGMIAFLALSIGLHVLAVRDARTVADRIPAGMTIAQVREIVGTGRVVVSFRARLVDFAYAHEESPPMPSAVEVFFLNVFFWWMPYVFGESD